MKRKVCAMFLMCWLLLIGGVTYAVAFDTPPPRPIDVPLPPCIPSEGCSDPPRTLCWGWQWVCVTLVWPFEFCWYQAVLVPCDTQQ